MLNRIRAALGRCGVRVVVGLASTGTTIRVRLAGIAPSRSARRPGGRAASLRKVRQGSENGDDLPPATWFLYLGWRVRPVFR
jgi:hypothetical protein